MKGQVGGGDYGNKTGLFQGGVLCKQFIQLQAFQSVICHSCRFKTDGYSVLLTKLEKIKIIMSARNFFLFRSFLIEIIMQCLSSLLDSVCELSINLRSLTENLFGCICHLGTASSVASSVATVDDRRKMEARYTDVGRLVRALKNS